MDFAEVEHDFDAVVREGLTLGEKAIADHAQIESAVKALAQVATEVCGEELPGVLADLVRISDSVHNWIDNREEATQAAAAEAEAGSTTEATEEVTEAAPTDEAAPDAGQDDPSGEAPTV